MPPRVREAELTRSVGGRNDHIVPVLRCHIVDTEGYDARAMLSACTGVTYVFSPYEDATDAEVSSKEVIVISCLGAKKEIGLLMEQHVFLRFPIPIPKTLGEKFQRQVIESGLWWLLLRFDDDSEFISFTVDLQGAILGRHIISLDGDLMFSKHDGTVH